MSRLPLLTYDATDDQQRALWDSIVDSRGGALTVIGPEGGLVGPFAAMVQRPHLGAPMVQLGAAVRFESSLDPRLLEIAITTVGARWRSEFEFWAHSGLALRAGVDPAIIDALASDREPVFADEDEQVVYRFTRALATDGHIDQLIYDDAVDRLGVDSVVDLTQTIGYYTQICFVLNAFEVPLPDGVTPVFSS